jgi:hypothetical protein
MHSSWNCVCYIFWPLNPSVDFGMLFIWKTLIKNKWAFWHILIGLLLKFLFSCWHCCRSVCVGEQEVSNLYSLSVIISSQLLFPLFWCLLVYRWIILFWVIPWAANLYVLFLMHFSLCLFCAFSLYGQIICHDILSFSGKLRMHHYYRGQQNQFIKPSVMELNLKPQVCS